MKRLLVLLLVGSASLLGPAASAHAFWIVVNVTGTGSGEVSGGEAKGEEIIPLFGEKIIDCYGPPKAGQCEGVIDEPDVLLSALAGPNSEFAGWSVEGGTEIGGCSGAGTECILGGQEGEEVTVTAEFVLVLTTPLTLNIEEGEGTVVTNPGGVECSGPEGTSCTTEEIEEGAVVLTASPAPGYLFKSWKKCDKKETVGEVNYGVNGRQCTINLSEAKEVSAKFVKSRELTTSTAGGIGTLQTRPGGVLCLANCTTATASFKDGFTVEAVGKPAKHFHFVEYLNGTGSAAVCNGEATCTVSLEEDSSIEGLFEEDPKVALSVSKEGGGQALIKSKPSGALCAYTCNSVKADFYEGELVVVAWKLAKGTSSIEWSSAAGTCEGTSEATEGSCTVPMSEAHSLVARFE